MDVEALLDRFSDWARARPDVRALALVGSHAKGTPGPASDVDLVLVCDDPARYAGSHDWLVELGVQRDLGTRRWGVLTERRLRIGGHEVNLGIVGQTWATTDPIDPGTRRVVLDGLRPLHDPDELLARLLAATPLRAAGEQA